MGDGRKEDGIAQTGESSVHGYSISGTNKDMSNS
jgi:hypothetical protein